MQRHTSRSAKTYARTQFPIHHRIVLCASMINTQGVRCRSYLPFTSKGVALISGQVGHEPTGMHYLFELKTSPCLP